MKPDNPIGLEYLKFKELNEVHHVALLIAFKYPFNQVTKNWNNFMTKMRTERRSPILRTITELNAEPHSHKKGLLLIASHILFCETRTISPLSDCYFWVTRSGLLWTRSLNRYHGWFCDWPLMSWNCSPQNPPWKNLGVANSSSFCEGERQQALHKWAWIHRMLQYKPSPTQR